MMVGTDMLHPMRSIVDAIFYVLRNGVTWRALPSDFPPWETVYYWFLRFAREAMFERLNAVLAALDREMVGREAQPSAAIIDSQMVATETPTPRAYDGGKKLTGMKRHAMVDTVGRVLLIGFSEANIHDSVGGAVLLKGSRRRYPFVKLVWANSAYKRPAVAASAAPARVEIVSGLAGQKASSSSLAPHGELVESWVVERSFAWFNRSRRLWRVCEAVLETISAMTYAASVFLLMRRVAKHTGSQ